MEEDACFHRGFEGLLILREKRARKEGRSGAMSN